MMNENLVRHIVTIEDPVEYQFTSKRCHFTQRQVGRDTSTFAFGLRLRFVRRRMSFLSVRSVITRRR